MARTGDGGARSRTIGCDAGLYRDTDEAGQGRALTIVCRDVKGGDHGYGSDHRTLVDRRVSAQTDPKTDSRWKPPAVSGPPKANLAAALFRYPWTCRRSRIGAAGRHRGASDGSCPGGNQMWNRFVRHTYGLGCLAVLMAVVLAACETPAPGVAAPTVSGEIPDISSLAADTFQERRKPRATRSRERSSLSSVRSDDLGRCGYRHRLLLTIGILS